MGVLSLTILRTLTVATLKQWSSIYPEVLREICAQEQPLLALEDVKAFQAQKAVGNALIEKFMEGLFIYFENEALMDEELARLKIKERVLIPLKSNYFDGVVQFFKGLFSPKNTCLRQIVANNH